MLNFLNPLFFHDDKKTIIGLCALELEKPFHHDTKLEFLNNFHIKKDFSTNFDKNILLSA